MGDKLRDGFYWANVQGVREVVECNGGIWFVAGNSEQNPENIDSINPNCIVEEKV